MKKQLRAGFARIKITPNDSVTLQGFAGRDELSKGVFCDLFAKAAYFRTNSVKSLLISLDVIGVSSKYATKIRNRINERYGIKCSNIMVCATHTHCAPFTVSLLGDANEDYLKFLEEKIIFVVGQAISEEEEITLNFAVTTEDFNINRRLPSDKGILFAPNPAGVCDKNVSIIKIDNLIGDPKAVIFNYVCHPTVWGGLEISSDFPGIAEKYLENHLKGCTAIFINGACGDIRANITDAEGKRFEESKNDVVRLGNRLGEKILNALPKAEEVSSERLICCSKLVDLPLHKVYSISDFKKTLEEKQEKLELLLKQEHTDIVKFEIVYEKGMLFWAQHAIELAEKNKLLDTINVEMQMLAIGNVVFVSLPGEVFCEIGNGIKDTFAPLKAVFVGYANGLVGYIPTAKALVEGGYESDDSHKLYGVPYPYAPETEEILLNTAKELCNEITN